MLKRKTTRVSRVLEVTKGSQPSQPCIGIGDDAAVEWIKVGFISHRGTVGGKACASNGRRLKVSGGQEDARTSRSWDRQNRH